MLNVILQVVQIIHVCQIVQALRLMALTREAATALRMLNVLLENVMTRNANLYSRGGHTLFCLEELR